MSEKERERGGIRKKKKAKGRCTLRPEFTVTFDRDVFAVDNSRCEV